MSVKTETSPPETVADLLERLGDVPAFRVRLDPPLGAATERDVVEAHDRENRLFELVDGVLVEKAMGFEESKWAVLLTIYLGAFVLRHDLGVVLGADGSMRLLPGLVRIPDVAFISWGRYPKGLRPGEIPAVAPDLAVEILSKSNTRREMARKLDEYFQAGVRLVWYVDPQAREVRVYESPADPVTLTAADVLEGGAVLPGFRLPLVEWFAQAERSGPAV